MNIHEAINAVQDGKKVTRPFYHESYIALKTHPVKGNYPAMYFSKQAHVPELLKGNFVPYAIGGNKAEIEATDWEILNA